MILRKLSKEDHSYRKHVQQVVAVERGAKVTFRAMIAIHVQTVLLQLVILDAPRH